MASLESDPESPESVQDWQRRRAGFGLYRQVALLSASYLSLPSHHADTPLGQEAGMIALNPSEPPGEPAEGLVMDGSVGAAPGKLCDEIGGAAA